MKPIVATKLYGYDWWPVPGGAPASAAEAGRAALADALEAAGTTMVLAQNQLDPLPASDVGQHAPPAPYSDLALRAALRARGIRCFESTAMFFHPQDLDRPGLRPIGADGSAMAPADWYVGLCPSDERYVEARIALLRRVVIELEADGVFLSFIRFPGFWERWTPGVDRSEITEHCFCPRCRRRFSAQTGAELPDGARAAAALLTGPLRAEWTDWKCAVITGVVARAREALREVSADVELMVNIVPFVGPEFGSLGERLLGQRIESLAAVADHFEVMVYHQILKQSPPDWIPRVVGAVRDRTERTILPCLQARPTYLDGIFAADGRDPEISAAEFGAAVAAVASSAADGVMTYHWSDVTGQDAVSGGAFSAALRHYGRSER
ncbi:MAG: putative glycoside hydrolase [Actinomycetia bacterium]|nr:putative glycoside hydrolase [Actinomycetes bacterium]